MSYYAINDSTKETQEMFHSGWHGDKATVCIKRYYDKACKRIKHYTSQMALW
jgi:hypothetical protein